MTSKDRYSVCVNMQTLNNKPEPKVRLKVAGQSVDADSLPDELIMSFCKAFEKETDSISILSTYAYVFCGLRINDIRDMIILTDKTGARTASREYVRQKIVAVLSKVHDEHISLHGDNSISPKYKPRNINQTEVCFSRYQDIIKEDIYFEGSEEEETEIKGLHNQISTGRKEIQTKEKEDKNHLLVSSRYNEKLHDHDNRPIDKSSGMVSLRGFIGRLLNRKKVDS